ncbi:MAG: hypothetical protein NC120_05435 [Ruminococcus sp.]|nr:hypothetical protein [Ruminococcus sp.]
MKKLMLTLTVFAVFGMLIFALGRSAASVPEPLDSYDDISWADNIRASSGVGDNAYPTRKGSGSGFSADGGRTAVYVFINDGDDLIIIIYDEESTG